MESKKVHQKSIKFVLIHFRARIPHLNSQTSASRFENGPRNKKYTGQIHFCFAFQNGLVVRYRLCRLIEIVYLSRTRITSIKNIK